MDITTLQDMAAALAKTDIEWLEIEGPGISVRLRRGQASPAASVPVTAGTTGQTPAPAARAPMAGVFLHRHPLQATALATSGDAVAAGQVVGLVQAGLLLMPVVAPTAGTVLAHALPHGTTVGYGDTLLPMLPLQPLLP